MLFAAVGKFDGGDFFLVFVKISLFALFRGWAGLRFNVVRGSVDVGATVGEDVLDGEDFGADVAQLLIDFLYARGGALAGLDGLRLGRRLVPAFVSEEVAIDLGRNSGGAQFLQMHRVQPRGDAR